MAVGPLDVPRLAPGTAREHAGRVLVISGSVGAGHDSTARELADRLGRAGVGVDVRDFLDAVPGWAAWVLREGYLATSRYCPAAFEGMFRDAERGRLSLRGFRGLAGLGAVQVRRWTAEKRYDAVVSTYPVSSQCLGEMRARGDCAVPVLTYVTDPAVHRAWVHRGVDAHLTVTRASAERGCRDHGLPMIAAGPLVPSRFARATRDGGRDLRRQLGLPGDRAVALVSAGSYGLGAVRRAAADVARAGCVALGWRTDVDVLMRAADVLVHNAGGMTFTEALVSGLPAVTYRPIPGHGRANAAALQQGGLAPWARDRHELAVFIRRQIGAGAPPSPPGDPTDVVLGVLAGSAVTP
jgi:UDP-N-acetylglucosamine:LPS N-acetylglucosamine transferase